MRSCGVAVNTTDRFRSDDHLLWQFVPAPLPVQTNAFIATTCWFELDWVDGVDGMVVAVVVIVMVKAMYYTWVVGTSVSVFGDVVVRVVVNCVDQTK